MFKINIIKPFPRTMGGVSLSRSYDREVAIFNSRKEAKFNI